MNVKDPVQAIRSVSRVITAVTGAPPKTVLALVEDGKQDDIRNGTGVEPRKERDESDERNWILGADYDKEKGNNKGEGSETPEPLGPASDD